MDEILISGNQVILRNVSEEKRVATSDFYEALSRGMGMRTPILPEGVMFYAGKEGRHLYATHEPPRTAILKVLGRDEAKEDDEIEYSLKMPHTYFFHLFVGAAFEALYVYACTRVVERASDTLCILPVKNLWPGGKVCLGNDLKFDLEGSVAMKIGRVQAHFWGSTFNDDLSQHYEKDMPKEIAQAGQGEEEHFEAWARLSTAEGFDPCKLSWKPHMPFSEAVDRILGEGGDS